MGSALRWREERREVRERRVRHLQAAMGSHLRCDVMGAQVRFESAAERVELPRLALGGPADRSAEDRLYERT